MPRKPVVLCVDDEWNGLEAVSYTHLTKDYVLIVPNISLASAVKCND